MKEKGFTLIELIISIFILVVAIIGTYSAFSIMAVLTSGVSSRLTAAYLAQEGLEIVRNIRDTNWLTPGKGWSDGLITDYTFSCEADYKTGTFAQLTLKASSGLGRYLNIDENNFYSYSLGQKTKFRRQIKITQWNGDENAIDVVVNIFWDEKASILNPTGSPGSIEAEEILYNWY